MLGTSPMPWSCGSEQPQGLGLLLVRGREVPLRRRELRVSKDPRYDHIPGTMDRHRRGHRRAEQVRVHTRYPGVGPRVFGPLPEGLFGPWHDPRLFAEERPQALYGPMQSRGPGDESFLPALGLGEDDALSGHAIPRQRRDLTGPAPGVIQELDGESSVRATPEGGITHRCVLL